MSCTPLPGARRTPALMLALAVACALAAVAPRATAQDGDAMPGVDRPGMDMPGMDMPDRVMHGTLGDYPMSRDASGTSWQPDSATMQALHVPLQQWMLMLHGSVTGAYTDQSGSRGATETYQTSMLMAHASRAVGEAGTLTLKGMLSLEPLEGARGYPLLYQAGETADGTTTLVDRQHPHNLVMEAAALYSVALAPGTSAFVYGGIAGEPALGPAVYMHRYASQWNAEAPLTHHWLDSTHVSYGVATLGGITGAWKFEASAFNGREPDQHRYNLEPGTLDSYSARVTLNPSANWSLQISHGRLAGPELFEPGVVVSRSTASATYHRRTSQLESETILAWGRNSPTGTRASNGFLLDHATTFAQRQTVYARLEHLDRDDLLAAAQPGAGQYHGVSKFTLGASRQIATAAHAALSLGAQLSTHRGDAVLAGDYGAHPYGLVVYLRAMLIP